ncbi:MAG: hypothetical protein IT438_14505 [Phycisphaerales bacterium]|nr:hypothetical protein [Phycisphaerales bacterium]
MAKRASRGGGGLSGASIHELRRELAERQRRAGTLARRRAKLLESLAKLDAEIAGTGLAMASGDGIRRRPKNDANLVESLQKLLNGKTMSVTEASEEVQKAGYLSTSPNFRTIVNQALINSKKFKRVDRGQYTSK